MRYPLHSRMWWQTKLGTLLYRWMILRPSGRLIWTLQLLQYRPQRCYIADNTAWITQKNKKKLSTLPLSLPLLYFPFLEYPSRWGSFSGSYSKLCNCDLLHSYESPTKPILTFFKSVKFWEWEWILNLPWKRAFPLDNTDMSGTFWGSWKNDPSPSETMKLLWIQWWLSRGNYWIRKEQITSVPMAPSNTYTMEPVALIFKRAHNELLFDHIIFCSYCNWLTTQTIWNHPPWLAIPFRISDASRMTRLSILGFHTPLCQLTSILIGISLGQLFSLK